MTKFIVL